MQCLNCKKKLKTKASKSAFCDNRCRSIFTRAMNLINILDGHYKTSENGDIIELETPSLKKYLISNFDYESLSRFNWTTDKNGYVVSKVLTTNKDYNIKMHRFILSAKKGQIVDHIDGNPSNNSRINLRIVNKSMNGSNRHKPNPKTGLIGISFLEKKGLYKTSHSINGKRYTKASKNLEVVVEFKMEMMKKTFNESSND